MNFELSVLIPSRNEEFLRHTIEDILANSGDKTEIIAVCDGSLPVEPIPDHPRLTLVLLSKSIGQRAATNLAARLSNAKYVMKTDAHTAWDKDFDKKLLADMQDDWTMVPIMRNLHVFNWKCEDGHSRYQGPSGNCHVCQKPTEKEIVWIPKPSPQSKAYRFDPALHFQYHRDFEKRPEGQGEISETMSLQGSCFLMTREKYWELNICDESHGSWGQQGSEVAIKTWTSGGRVVCNKKTWYAHMFRTSGGDFSFPYPLSGKDQEKARKHSRDLFYNGKWEGMKKPLSWLIEKFAPVPDWSSEAIANLKAEERKRGWHQEEQVKEEKKVEAPAIIKKRQSKGIIYYTDSQCPEPIAEAVRCQLERAAGDIPIVSVSLGKAIPFGENIVIERPRGIKSMFLQILAGLERSTADVVYFCEHDCIYPKEHFDLLPDDPNAYFYNQNVWKLNYATGDALFYRCHQTLGLIANRLLLVEHYHKRLAKMAQNVRDLTARGEQVKRDGYSIHMGYEPGKHSPPRGVDNYPYKELWSSVPVIDIRHSANLTASRWSKEEFRDQKACKEWTESDSIPGWGLTRGRAVEFIDSLINPIAETVAR